MGYDAKIILDSINEVGNRLTTFEISIPKFIQAELNTHRALSRNSASSRAIPTKKMIERVMTDPVLPVWWGKNQSGMSAREELSDEVYGSSPESTPRWGLSPRGLAKELWLDARTQAVDAVIELGDIGLHKQIANRILEPFLFTSVIVSGTQWGNFFAQRCHPDAQPEFRFVADMMKKAMEESTPKVLKFGGWHLPYIRSEDLQHNVDLKLVSVARCARVSYLTHDGVRDIEEDIKLAEKLMAQYPPHLSPFEHVAQVLDEDIRHNNFRGWYQYRQFVEKQMRYNSGC